MARTKATVTYTFSVTFKAPTGMSVPSAREAIKVALTNAGLIGIEDRNKLKVHLTNKEVTYGKR